MSRPIILRKGYLGWVVWYPAIDELGMRRFPNWADARDYVVSLLDG